MATPDSFIVDNTSEDWKALNYVREWCDISDAIDIATGHFEIGADAHAHLQRCGHGEGLEDRPGAVADQ